MNGGNLNLSFDWSPDSKNIAYSRTHTNSKPYYYGRVYVLNLKTGKKSLIAGEGYVSPHWVSDKTFITLIQKSKLQGEAIY